MGEQVAVAFETNFAHFVYFVHGIGRFRRICFPERNLVGKLLLFAACIGGGGTETKNDRAARARSFYIRWLTA